MRRLSDAGARVIAFDILFIEPQEQPVRQAVQALRCRFEALDLSEHHAGLRALHHTLVALAEAEAPDDEFAAALRAARHTVLAFALEAGTAGQSSVPAATVPSAFTNGV